MTALQLLDEPGRLRVALTPLRRRLLALLQQPLSATEVAAQIGLPRQKVNYHLRVLEAEGLVDLVELRQRRGCTERILKSTAGAFVVDPAVVGAAPAGVGDHDRHAAEHLISVAGDTIRSVTRMQTESTRNGRRLLTFTVETEIAFAEPANVYAFTDALAASVAALSAQFHQSDGRRYRVVIGGHPASAS